MGKYKFWKEFFKILFENNNSFHSRDFNYEIINKELENAKV